MLVFLKRPRHDNIVKELNKMNVKINYITDGDIAGALSVIGENPKNDIYYSTGGAPEGVVLLRHFLVMEVKFKEDWF